VIVFSQMLYAMLKSQPRILAHLVFSDPQAKRKKPKEPIFLPAHGQTNNETNEMYIEKRDKRDFCAILAT